MPAMQLAGRRAARWSSKECCLKDKQIGRERDQRVVRTWNPLPDSLKRVGTVEGFKIGYDEWVGGGGRVGD